MKMMRTIKFRGKRTDKRRWVYGYLTRILDIPGSPYQEGYYISDECGLQPVYLVEDVTVGQFTGLTDKNGNEIYEGDIFESTFNPQIYRRITDEYGVYKGETYDIHPGVLVRMTIAWDNKECCFTSRSIYVNPVGLKIGSTLIPQREIAVGDEYHISHFFDENIKSEIIGNIHDNPDLLTTEKKLNS